MLSLDLGMYPGRDRVGRSTSFLLSVREELVHFDTFVRRAKHTEKKFR
jgi:hypothetical protein